MNHVRNFPTPMNADDYLAGRLAEIPPHFQFVRWNTVGPSTKSRMPMPLQEKLWADVKASPESGHALFGPSAWGKTVIEIALYRYILNKHKDLISISQLNPNAVGKAAYISGTAIVRTTAKRLMEAYRAWEMGDEGAPLITPASIKAFHAVGIRSYLFLGEFEKMRSSEFKREIIFDVLDALRDYDGYLVVTGNLSYDDLEDEEKYPAGAKARVDHLCRIHDLWKM